MRQVYLGIAVFLISLVYEWVETRLLYAVERRQGQVSATLSALLEGFSWVYVVAFAHSYWLALPSILGAYLGTLASVNQENRQDGAAPTRAHGERALS